MSRLAPRIWRIRRAEHLAVENGAALGRGDAVRDHHRSPFVLRRRRADHDLSARLAGLHEPVCFDYLANEFSKSRYMTNGQVKVPLVVRTGNGGAARFGAQHSQSVENWCMMIPGLKVVAPSTPRDVVGLMAAAVRDPDPVIFFEH